MGVNVRSIRCAPTWPIRILPQPAKAVQVHVIRCGISDDEYKGIDFAKCCCAGHPHPVDRWPRVSAERARAALPARCVPRDGAGTRFRLLIRRFQGRLFGISFDELDANGITLAGVELGNEIIFAAFNPEFPLPGEGRFLFSLRIRKGLRGPADRERFWCSTSDS